MFFVVLDYTNTALPYLSIIRANFFPLDSFNISLVHAIRYPYDVLSFSLSKVKYLKQLESQYVKTLARVAQLEALEKENKELKKLVETQQQKNSKKKIVGTIISLSYPSISFSDNELITVNSMIILDDVLVGTVGDVDKFSAKANLLNQKRKQKILAKTQSGIVGLIDGDGSNVLLTQLQRDALINLGETVVTVGQEGIEANILIGTIESIVNEHSSATQLAKINQHVSFYEASFVEVW